MITQKDGRRNRYQIQAHLPVPEPGTREPAVGEVVALFTAGHQTGNGAAQASDRDTGDARQARTPGPGRQAVPGPAKSG